MGQRLEGKVSVITGGGGGIGGAVAVDMAAEGAKIVVNDIGKDENGKSYANKIFRYSSIYRRKIQNFCAFIYSIMIVAN